MDRDAQLLKEKALLLLNRERELWLLRRKHHRVSAWLSVAHSIPEIAAPGIDPPAAFDRLAHKLMSLLELQRVGFYRLDELRERGLPAEALALVRRDGCGVCDEPGGEPLEALARAVGLHRFMWYLVSGAVLMVAGYDREKAPFYERFDEAEVGQWKSMGRHLDLQLRNAALIGELERETDTLERLNATLENRVAERTAEIATTNRELARALATLEDKDRRLTEDLEQARLFQRRILPATPSSRRAEFGVVYRPLESVSGDIFDICELGEGHFRLFLADATGHGVQASMRTIVLKSEYDRIKTRHATPAALFQEFNRRLLERLDPAEMLCTGCCFDVLLGDGGGTPLVRYVNAAHPPLVRVSGGVAHEIYRDGPFLGLSADVPFTSSDVPIARGDLVFAYTDGLCDQLDAGRAPFPLEATLAASGSGGAPLAIVVEAVMRAFDRFRGDLPAADDITLVGVRAGG